MDTVVAVNSTHNVSYTCRSDQEDLIWVVNKFSVWPNLLERLADIGVWTEVIEPGYLSLVMNPEGGEAREISVSCMTYTSPFGFGESSQTIWIISFGGLPFFACSCSSCVCISRSSRSSGRSGAGLLFSVSTETPVV